MTSKIALIHCDRCGGVIKRSEAPVSLRKTICVVCSRPIPSNQFGQGYADGERACGDCYPFQRPKETDIIIPEEHADFGSCNNNCRYCEECNRCALCRQHHDPNKRWV